jgi:two-component system, NtrC family, sensor histidine kinase HydH
MRFPLIWRILAPTLGVSLVLLAVGLAAAIYGYLWNDRISRLLETRVSAVLATQELVLSIRDVRHALSRYDLTHDEDYLKLAETAILETGKLLPELSKFALDEEHAALQQIGKELKVVKEEIDKLPMHPPSSTEVLRASITTLALVPTQEMLDRRQIAVSEESRLNRVSADRIGMSLAILGLCGAGAGLLAGFGMARGITRSIEQLGGSVHSVAETISDSDEPAMERPVGFHELIATVADIKQKTAGIMDELEQSREKATRSDQLAAVGQLAAGIAHELRNPLTAVKLLVDGAVEQSTPLSGTELLVLQDEVAHMEQMTQSFLDFARPPKLTRQPIELNQVIEQCQELVRRRCGMLGIQMTIDARPITVMGDPQQLRQVILNLLLNAIDAQPNGGSIMLVIQEDQPNRRCVIEVVDRGNGISDELNERIFDPFVSSKETGMGLGLAISRRIVRSHGGDITAISRGPGENGASGATFRITLPLSDIPSGATHV